MIKFAGRLALTLVCGLFLAACAAETAPAPDTDGAQDIQPGDRTVIQEPARSAPEAPIQERDI